MLRYDGLAFCHLFEIKISKDMQRNAMQVESGLKIMTTGRLGCEGICSTEMGIRQALQNLFHGNQGSTTIDTMDGCGCK